MSARDTACRSDTAGHVARPAPRALTGDDDPLVEDLAAPDAPRLPPIDGRGQAALTDRAGRAQRLGLFQLDRALGEPQVGIARSAGQDALPLAPRIGCHGATR